MSIDGRQTNLRDSAAHTHPIILPFEEHLQHLHKLVFHEYSAERCHFSFRGSVGLARTVSTSFTVCECGKRIIFFDTMENPSQSGVCNRQIACKTRIVIAHI